MAIAIGVVVLLAIAGWDLLLRSPTGTATEGACPALAQGPLSVENTTADLGGVFQAGSIQAFGSNQTSILLGGLSAFDQSAVPFVSEPAAAELAGTPGSSAAINLTSLLAPYFSGGGIFPPVWNGSAWLIAGQTRVAGELEGSAVFLQGSRVTDLTSLLSPFFRGQGIFIAGWDGTGWLIGGNETSEASLVYLENGAVTNLSGLIPHNRAGDWVQVIGWNGAAWLVGGFGVFGTWSAGRYTDLYPTSAFTSGGVYALGWNGSAWLASGEPAVLEVLDGSSLTTGPGLSNWTTGWVSSIVPLAGGWLLAGASSTSDGKYNPRVELSGGEAGRGVLDVSACLPGAFSGGWVQFASGADPLPPGSVLLVGEGRTNPVTGSSHGAAATIGLPLDHP
ncbi:MAG: hypothetical protein L3K09_08460 [Thermoplasmata archaeon]|nr:hypothetical protein [Thermoplasmata archaeon]